MTRRAQLTANGLQITLAQHKQLLDAIAAWEQTTEHVCDRCNRNYVTDETDVRVELRGVSKTEIEAKLADLDTAVASLPGDWPTPSEAATLRPE